jgi:hypothetical protein
MYYNQSEQVTIDYCRLSTTIDSECESGHKCNYKQQIRHNRLSFRFIAVVFMGQDVTLCDKSSLRLKAQMPIRNFTNIGQLASSLNGRRARTHTNAGARTHTRYADLISQFFPLDKVKAVEEDWERKKEKGAGRGWQTLHLLKEKALTVTRQCPLVLLLTLCWKQSKVLRSEEDTRHWPPTCDPRPYL